MLLTVLLVIGIRESAEANSLMVAIKLVAIVVFVSFAVKYVDTANWKPFMPNRWQGVLTGGAIVFFTYIGFDSVSTAAEECKNPKRDLPLGILFSLAVCTLFYVSVAIVLTGIQPWNSATLATAAPVINALHAIKLYRVERWVTLGALTGMMSSLLVFQLGQARVWFAMSRDGLFPKILAACTPAIARRTFPPGSPASSSGSLPACSTWARSPIYRISAHCSPSLLSLQASSSFAIATPIVPVPSARPVVPSRPSSRFLPACF